MKILLSRFVQTELASLIGKGKIARKFRLLPLTGGGCVNILVPLCQGVILTDLKGKYGRSHNKNIQGK